MDTTLACAKRMGTVRILAALAPKFHLQDDPDQREGDDFDRDGMQDAAGAENDDAQEERKQAVRAKLPGQPKEAAQEFAGGIPVSGP